MIDRALLPWHDYLICLLINSTIFDGIYQVDNRMEVVSFAMLISYIYMLIWHRIGDLLLPEFISVFAFLILVNFSISLRIKNQ